MSRFVVFGGILAVTFTVGSAAGQTAREKIAEFNELVSDSDRLVENINRKCSGEWPSDFVMQRHCREQQHEGYSDLADIWAAATQNIRTAAGQCVLDWSDDLLFDWTMIHYCVDQQLTAWRALR